MKKSIFASSVILSLLSNEVLGRGGYKPTEAEYRSWPGSSWTTKIGDDWVVPAIVDMNFDTQKEAIKSRIGQFKILKVKRIKDSSEKGKIISQLPKGGLLVKTVGTLEITVSDGPN